MKIILKLNSWQVFLPMLFVLIFDMSLNPLEHQLISQLLTVFIAGLFFLWVYALGAEFSKIIPKGIPTNLNKLNLWFSICLISILVAAIAMAFMWLAEKSNLDNALPFFFMGIFSYMVSVINVFRYVARAISIWELKREVGFGEYAGNFFLIWFFPLGVWFIQPKANKMINGSALTSHSSRPRNRLRSE